MTNDAWSYSRRILPLLQMFARAEKEVINKLTVHLFSSSLHKIDEREKHLFSLSFTDLFWNLSFQNVFQLDDQLIVVTFQSPRCIKISFAKKKIHLYSEKQWRTSISSLCTNESHTLSIATPDCSTSYYPSSDPHGIRSTLLTVQEVKTNLFPYKKYRTIELPSRLDRQEVKYSMELNELPM